MNTILPGTVDELKSVAENRFEHALYRKNLREKIEANLVVTHNGGMFKASTELISFLSVWDSPTVFLEDVYQNPIQCNKDRLLKDLKEAYQYAMNAWHIEFEQSKRIRKLDV